MKAVQNKMKSLVGEVKKMSKVIERLQAQERQLLEVEKGVQNITTEVNNKVKSDGQHIEKVVKEQNAEVKKEVASYSTRLSDIEERVIYLEGRGRRKNLIFMGVKEEEREDCEQVARSVIKEGCKVTESVTIERAHRIGKSRRAMVGRKANEPRPLIVMFLSYG